MENGRYYRAVRHAKAIQLLDWPHVLSPLNVKTQRAQGTTRLACGDQAGWGERSGVFFRTLALKDANIPGP